MSKLYNPDKNVLDAAIERLSTVFDQFQTVCISLSGGKDSTVLFHLAYKIAQERGRILYVLIIDLEAQYELTIEHLKELVSLPGLDVMWVCLPLNLRNAVSVFSPHWCCWQPGVKWVRELPELSCVIRDQNYFPFYEYRMEFETFVSGFPTWLEGKTGFPVAQLVGIRADESTNRYNAVKPTPKKGCIKKGAYKGINWSIVGKGNNASFFPIYDWRFEDIWCFLGKERLPYCKLYDRMYLAGVPFRDMRICQPYGDDQRKGLDVWAEIEPESWIKIVDRVAGANYGAIYAGGRMLGSQRGNGSDLPLVHNNWKSYTFFLLSTLPGVMRERFLSNFAVFLEWYQRHGYPDIRSVHDGIEDGIKAKKGTPSWKRFAIAILKNDFNCKSLSISGVKHVQEDVYSRVESGEPVKVRKSVIPVYEFLRSEYQRYLSDGIESVALEFTPTPNLLKEKYEFI
jgi:predicted phosphoadenosine phosphosulfate sulfurtransferase